MVFVVWIQKVGGRGNEVHQRQTLLRTCSMKSEKRLLQAMTFLFIYHYHQRPQETPRSNSLTSLESFMQVTGRTTLDLLVATLSYPLDSAVSGSST